MRNIVQFLQYLQVFIRDEINWQKFCENSKHLTLWTDLSTGHQISEGWGSGVEHLLVNSCLWSPGGWAEHDYSNPPPQIPLGLFVNQYPSHTNFIHYYTRPPTAAPSIPEKPTFFLLLYFDATRFRGLLKAGPLTCRRS